MSSPERGSRYGYNQGGAYEDPYYAQYGSRTGSITPVIDEEARYVRLIRLKKKKMFPRCTMCMSFAGVGVLCGFPFSSVPVVFSIL